MDDTFLFFEDDKEKSCFRKGKKKGNICLLGFTGFFSEYDVSHALLGSSSVPFSTAVPFLGQSS